MPLAMLKVRHQQASGAVAVAQRPDGTLMLRTYFEFLDGDCYPFYLSEFSSGGLRLSDHGYTLIHITMSAISTHF